MLGLKRIFTNNNNDNKDDDDDDDENHKTTENKVPAVYLFNFRTR